MPAAADTPDVTATLAPHRSRSLTRSGLLIGAATAWGMGLNIVFHFALAHILDPGEYSLLASGLVLIYIVTIPAVALQAAVARDVASHLAAGEEVEAGVALRESLLAVSRLMIGLVLVGAVLAYPAIVLLNVHRELFMVAVGASAIAALVLPAAWGGLQGAQRFGALGFNQALTATAKLIVGAGLALAGIGVTGIMFGVAGATAAAAIAALVPLRGLWELGHGQPLNPRRLFSVYVTAAAVIFSLFAILTSIDLLVARAAFTPHVAGLYAAASVGARTLLLLPVAVTTVLFPRVATLQDAARERRHLVAGVAVVAAGAALGTAIMFLAPGPILDIAFGPSYRGAGSWLGPLGLAMSFYAVANVYCFHFVSLGRMRYAVVLGGVVIAQICLFAALHARPAQLVGIQIGCGLATVVASELFDRLTE
jgi:O-antigen/teichoic acid export membrane protein